MLGRLSLLWRRFTPLEKWLLDEIRKVVPVGAQPAFDLQVAAINRVVRMPPAWGEILFYARRNWADVPPFPCADEFRLAQVNFRSAGRSYKAVLSSISGHIFDFVITPGPKNVAFLPWEGTPTVKLLGDPLRLSTGEREREVLPAEWQDLLKRHSRLSATWELYDETSAYRIVLGDEQYLVLAQRHGTFGPHMLLHRVEPIGEGFYHLSDDHDIPKLLARSIESVIGESPSER